MKHLRNLYMTLAAVIIFLPALAQADGHGHHLNPVEHNIIGVQGYDLVSYHTNTGPVTGTNDHTSSYKGITYLFANEANKKSFDANPAKYIPAYGGFCAYGVAVGKKFSGDPKVWEVVDGKLYLNLNKKVQGLWSQDISGNISKAQTNWPKIKGTKASDL